MEKNINGCPMCKRTDRREMLSCTSGEVGGQSQAPNHSCGDGGTCLDALPLAYVYAPDQKFRMLYSASEALKHGTLFEELYKPMEVYGRE